MSEEIKVILEEIRFKAGIYRDHKRRGLSFNDEEKNCALLLDYIQQKENQIKEIERLNNIINELEKTLNNYDLDYMDLVGEHLLADILEDLKDKIKELKGSDK